MGISHGETRCAPGVQAPQRQGLASVDGRVTGIPGQLDDRAFRLFRDFLFQQAGISLSDAKKQLVAGRLAKRLRHLGLDSYTDYYRVLRSDKLETQTAIDLLTTNETFFFREPRHFDFLRDHALPGLKGKGKVRVWSGACSSGEEPYTLAMVMAEVLGARPWEIVASDLSSRVLATAREGLYAMEDAAGIDRGLLRKYCLKGVGSQEGSFLIKPELRARIEFRQVNLNTPLPDLGGQFDIVFLRNVMIYFNLETKRRVVERIFPVLRPGGYLVLSHSENLNGVSDILRVVRPSVYRKPEN